MLSYVYKYNVIKPYVSFKVRNFNSKRNKQLITLYYTSLSKFIKEGTTKTIIKNKSYAVRIIKILRMKIITNKLSAIPIPPHITVDGKTLKRRLYIKKKYFLLVYNNIRLYTNEISKMMPVDPVKYAKLAFSLFPKTVGSRNYGYTLFNSINSFTAMTGFYTDLSYITSEGFINSLLEKYKTTRISLASILII